MSTQPTKSSPKYATLAPTRQKIVYGTGIDLKLESYEITEIKVDVTHPKLKEIGLEIILTIENSSKPADINLTSKITMTTKRESKIEPNTSTAL